MTATTKNRRERLRRETAQEIKAIALKLMAQGGPDAISLRAIAREMGMTAGAIYSYYSTRDDLITILTAEMYTALVDKVEKARDALPEQDAAGRILAWAQAFRNWALANPEGFRLVYGDPVPGYQPPTGGPVAAAEARACAGLVGLVAAAWPQAKALQSAEGYQWSDFGVELAEAIQRSFPDLPPAAVALALRMWGRMYGLLALEIYGHLGPQTKDPAKLYEVEMGDLIRSLGLVI